LALQLSGLRAGRLTFGGAYPVIPLLQRDVVEIGRGMGRTPRVTPAVTARVPDEIDYYECIIAGWDMSSA
jgi:hypothetical protein